MKRILRVLGLIVFFFVVLFGVLALFIPIGYIAASLSGLPPEASADLANIILRLGNIPGYIIAGYATYRMSKKYPKPA